MNNDERISYVLKNTRFIFRPNLSGDPSADKYGSTTRKATIVVPDSSMVEDMLTRGINVKLLPPRNETEEPVHFVTAIANFDSRIPPRIYLVSGNNPARLLNEETVGEIDNVYVLNVNASLNP